MGIGAEDVPTLGDCKGGVQRMLSRKSAFLHKRMAQVPDATFEIRSDSSGGERLPCGLVSAGFAEFGLAEGDFH